MTVLHRRNALGLLGAGMALLAGCSETADDGGNSAADDGGGPEADAGDGDLPSYASILPTTEESTFFYGAIDVETMATLLNDAGAKAGEEPTDPLVSNPVVVALLCSFGLELLGRSAGFEAYVSNNETPDGDEQFVYAEGVYAFVGAYDHDGLAADLERAGYALETETDAYAVYAATGSDEIVGVSDEVYAYSYPNGGDEFDPVAAVERTVATAAGERDPKHESSEAFERLLRTGDTRGISCCLYTDADAFDSATLSDDQAGDSDSLEFAFDAFEGAYGAHQGLRVAGDAAATARATVVYSRDDRVDMDLFESVLGTEAETVEHERADTTVTIDAEYGGEFARE
ncbi:hypothetical protein [Natronorubrum sulfidifaciens]|uniref:Uncharacterized protein n=1 Tax=Natronorubrum sulfidifaciens JCM 14089 TaxID=1230460 RepID=L9W1Z6_9EURY|nr:hypothetical protein [Natronorubrum sulfidifaciens]ELY42348.1 hypothetical protein C495_15127 [Natronorubrum sulfidifaciens JCM 14089]